MSDRTREPARVRYTGSQWIWLLTLCSALLFEGMSLSSINVQVADIHRELAMGPDTLHLVASAFLTAYAGVLLLGGACADRWDTTKVFIAGVVLFGAGSAGCALAPGAGWLIAGRAVQGAGAALTAPAAISLITTGFPAGPARNRALGVLSTTGAVGFSLGVLAGGAATATLGWRWGFGLFPPLCLVVVLLARRLPRPARAVAPRAEIPWVPAALLTAGLITVVYGIGRVGVGGAGEVLLLAATGVALLAGFASAQQRGSRPLVPFDLVRRADIAGPCMAIGGGFAAITGAMFLVGEQLQQHGHSPMQVGLALLPQGLAVGLCSPVVARMMARPRRVLVAGTVLVLLGQLLYTTAISGNSALHLLPACALVGAGIAACYPSATSLVSTAAEADGRQATAAGLLTTGQQAGGAFGVAVVAAAHTTTGSATTALVAAAFVAGLAVLGVGCAVRPRAPSIPAGR